jgi:ATP-dependent DNA ligase
VIEIVKSRSSTPARLPDFVEPMKAKLVGSMPSGSDWIYEIKFDGYRAFALRGGNETRILSRNQKDLGGKFPEVKDSIAALNIQDVIIDGEIVALDEKGRSSFQLLQHSTWVRKDHQSSSMHLICSSLTPRTFDFYRLKKGRQSWKNY